jgi:hypothetical protein
MHAATKHPKGSGRTENCGSIPRRLRVARISKPGRNGICRQSPASQKLKWWLTLCVFACVSLATLRAIVPAAIVSSPRDQSVKAGDFASFNVLASGDAPLDYQWYFNGTPVSGFGDTFTVSQARPEDAGSYWVVVSNAGGSATSDRASLVVTAPPTIESQPQGQRAASGESATFSVLAAGAPPLRFQWFFNGVHIAGATEARFTIMQVQSRDQGEYSVTVSNDSGSVDSNPAHLEVTGGDGLPRILTPPQAQIVALGSDVTFSVTATGEAPLAYEWRFNDQVVAGSGLASLTLTNIQMANLGVYSVRVSNGSGAVISDGAVLSVGPLLSRPRLEADLLQLSVLVAPDRAYRVQFSTNLGIWTDATNFTSSTTNFLFRQQLAPASAAGYYRVVSP